MALLVTVARNHCLRLGDTTYKTVTVLKFHVLHFHVLQFRVLQFHALLYGPSISGPSFSCPSFSAPPKVGPDVQASRDIVMCNLRAADRAYFNGSKRCMNRSFVHVRLYREADQRSKIDSVDVSIVGLFHTHSYALTVASSHGHLTLMAKCMGRRGSRRPTTYDWQIRSTRCTTSVT